MGGDCRSRAFSAGIQHSQCMKTITINVSEIIRDIPVLPVGMVIAEIKSSDDTLGEMLDDLRH